VSDDTITADYCMTNTELAAAIERTQKAISEVKPLDPVSSSLRVHLKLLLDEELRRARMMKVKP